MKKLQRTHQRRNPRTIPSNQHKILRALWIQPFRSQTKNISIKLYVTSARWTFNGEWWRVRSVYWKATIGKDGESSLGLILFCCIWCFIDGFSVLHFLPPIAKDYPLSIKTNCLRASSAFSGILFGMFWMWSAQKFPLLFAFFPSFPCNPFVVWIIQHIWSQSSSDPMFPADKSAWGQHNDSLASKSSAFKGAPSTMLMHSAWKRMALSR